MMATHPLIPLIPAPPALSALGGPVPATHPHRAPVADAADLLGLAGLLLDYPRPTLLAARADLAELVHGLGHGAPARQLQTFADWFAAADAAELPAEYVRTFDLRRRTTLHLTYYRFGETRRRGAALVELKAAYRAAGLTVADGELPDFLPALLQLAALTPDGTGEAALAGQRTGLELLYRSLRASRSPYRHLVGAVRLVLGDLPETDVATLDSLMADGPPTEQVGAGGVCPLIDVAPRAPGSAASSPLPPRVAPGGEQC